MAITRLRRQLEDQGYVPVSPTAQDNGTFILYGINTQNQPKSLTIATGVNNGITENSIGQAYNPATQVTPASGNAVTGLAPSNTPQDYVPLANELGRVLKIDILHADDKIITTEPKFILVDGVWLQDSRDTTVTIIARSANDVEDPNFSLGGLKVRVHLTRLITGMKLALSFNFNLYNRGFSRNYSEVMDITQIYSQLTEEALLRGYVDLWINLRLNTGDTNAVTQQTTNFGDGISDSFVIMGEVHGWIVDQNNPNNVSPDTATDFILDTTSNINGIIYDPDDSGITSISYQNDPLIQIDSLSQTKVTRSGNMKPVAIYSKGFRGNAQMNTDAIQSVGVMQGKHICSLRLRCIDGAPIGTTEFGLYSVSRDENNKEILIPVLALTDRKILLADGFISDEVVSMGNDSTATYDRAATFAIDFDSGKLYVALNSIWRNGGAWDKPHASGEFDLSTIQHDATISYDPSRGGTLPVTYGAICQKDIWLMNREAQQKNIRWVKGFKQM